MNEFMRATMTKALYTMAETALGIIGTATLLSEINWGALISAVIISGVVTVLKCIAVDLPKYTAGEEELTDEDAKEFADELE